MIVSACCAGRRLRCSNVAVGGGAGNGNGVNGSGNNSGGYTQVALHELVVWTAFTPAQCKEYAKVLHHGHGASVSVTPLAALRKLRELAFR